MLPVLFTIGPIKIYTFGVFLFLGFITGSFFLWKNIRLTSHKEEQLFDGIFLSVFFALFFSRFVYFLLNFDDFGLNILKFILINGYPGFSLYGFLFGFFIFFLLFFKIKKVNLFEVIDYLIPSFFIFLFFFKMGSFLSGNEIGIKTDFFLKTKYLGINDYRHLTAFYEAIFFIIGFFISFRILFEIRKEKFFKGFLFYFFIFYFSLVTYFFDIIKDNKSYIFNLSFDGLISFLLLLTTGSFFMYYFKDKILSFFLKSGKEILKKIHFRTKKKTS